MDFPKLPPLDDLEDGIDLQDDLDFNDIKEMELNNQSRSSQVSYNADLELPGLPDLAELMDEEVSDNIEMESQNDDEDFEDAKELESEEEYINENFPETNDFPEEDLEGEDDLDLNHEDDLDFSQNLLPEVNKDNNEEDSSVIINDNINDKLDETKKNKPKKNKSKEFREIDDEAIKEFFTNVKNKLFKPNEKKSKKIKKETSKPIGKILGLLKIAGILILILGIIFGIISFILRAPTSSIENISYEVKEGNTLILLNNLEKHEDGIELFIKNQGPTSTSFFMDIEFNVKESMLKKESFICQSDIIFLEIDKEIKETMRCENFIESNEYSIEVHFKEIK